MQHPIKHVRRYLCCALFFLLCLALPAAGADGNREIKARAKRYYYGQGVEQSYERALGLYLQAAGNGDAEAQYIAGGMYFKGLGTPVNHVKAIELLYKAAQSGVSTVESEKILGQSFLLGRGVPKNLTEAHRFYTEAAEKGDSEANNELGFMYFVGHGVEQNYEKAFELFEIAARKGLVMAQYNVGIMLYSGNGVPAPDLVAAYAWLSVAATNGHSQAAQVRDLVEASLSKAKLLQAQKQARELFLKLPAPTQPQ